MGEIVNIFKKDENDASITGPAKCMACGYEYVAVSPVGVAVMECPECHCHRATWKGLAVPSNDKKVWVCNCGNDLFMIVDDGGIMCAVCGLYQKY